jgi:hypothetical protein
MAGGGVSASPGTGRAQIINGQTYEQYSPQWYDAMRDSNVEKGRTLGRTTKAAYDAMGNPADTESSSGSGSGSLEGIANTIPRIGDSPDGGGGTFAGPGRVEHINPIDMSKANSAAFGRAKDQVGQETSGALTGLRSALASRGMLGSGAESRGTVSAITKGQGQLGEVSRQQAENEANQNLDIAKTNYSGDISQRGQDVTTRGQDMDYRSTHRGQDITQRGQDIQQQEANASLQMTKSLQEAARRQEILNGIIKATSGQTLY